MCIYYFFFFNDTATTEIYTLSLHDALPIFARRGGTCALPRCGAPQPGMAPIRPTDAAIGLRPIDRKSTRLNSSHANISYAVFCLKKKKKRCPQSCAVELYVTQIHDVDHCVT